MLPSEFEIGQDYSNRRGKFKVLAINGDELQVNYEGDTHCHALSAELQARIISNMTIEKRVRSGMSLRTGDDRTATERGQRHVEEWMLRDWRWWTMVGFLAARVQALMFYVPPDQIDKLMDELLPLTTVETGRGIYIDEHDRWGYSGRVRFTAFGEEVKWLSDFLAGYCTVSPKQDGCSDSYTISKNAIVFELLSLGFILGFGNSGEEWIARIRLNVPWQHLQAFDRGADGRLFCG
jgi:hypothetical protein